MKLQSTFNIQAFDGDISWSLLNDLIEGRDDTNPASFKYSNWRQIVTQVTNTSADVDIATTLGIVDMRYAKFLLIQIRKEKVEGEMSDFSPRVTLSTTTPDTATIGKFGQYIQIGESSFQDLTAGDFSALQGDVTYTFTIVAAINPVLD